MVGCEMVAILCGAAGVIIGGFNVGFNIGSAPIHCIPFGYWIWFIWFIIGLIISFISGGQIPFWDCSLIVFMLLLLVLFAVK